MNLYGVFILTKIENGVIDQGIKEFDSLETMLGEIRSIIALDKGDWKAITIIKSEDMPRMMESAYPTPENPQ